ncbi:MAG: Dabb family protein [Oscillospiraceae bacterium]|nr:Dabb family protein [Oscillospiraceae bacterium]
MVKHIVMWKLAPLAAGGTKEENARKMKEKLEGLKGQVEGLLQAEVGINYNPNGYDVCLYTEFTDAAEKAYQNHPAHLEVKKFVHQVITDRVVADYEA